MFLINKKNATPGTRVKLYKPDPMYIIGPANPVIGSRYECEGTITNSSSSTGIGVRWDNGSSNGYRNNELCLSIEGNFINIWEENN